MEHNKQFIKERAVCCQMATNMPNSENVGPNSETVGPSVSTAGFDVRSHRRDPVTSGCMFDVADEPIKEMRSRN